MFGCKKQVSHGAVKRLNHFPANQSYNQNPSSPIPQAVSELAAWSHSKFFAVNNNPHTFRQYSRPCLKIQGIFDTGIYFDLYCLVYLHINLCY